MSTRKINLPVYNEAADGIGLVPTSKTFRLVVRASKANNCICGFYLSVPSRKAETPNTLRHLARKMTIHYEQCPKLVKTATYRDGKVIFIDASQRRLFMTHRILR